MWSLESYKVVHPSFWDLSWRICGCLSTKCFVKTKTNKQKILVFLFSPHGFQGRGDWMCQRAAPLGHGNLRVSFAWEAFTKCTLMQKAHSNTFRLKHPMFTVTTGKFLFLDIFFYQLYSDSYLLRTLPYFLSNYPWRERKTPWARVKRLNYFLFKYFLLSLANLALQPIKNIWTQKSLILHFFFPSFSIPLQFNPSMSLSLPHAPRLSKYPPRFWPCSKFHR